MLPAQKSAISYDFSLLVFFSLNTNREVGKLDGLCQSWGFARQVLQKDNESR